VSQGAEKRPTETGGRWRSEARGEAKRVKTKGAVEDGEEVEEKEEEEGKREGNAKIEKAPRLVRGRLFSFAGSN
jgi:hypothetical protein